MFIVISLAYLSISIRRMNNNYSPDSCEFPTEIVNFQVPVVLISRHTWNVWIINNNSGMANRFCIFQLNSKQTRIINFYTNSLCAKLLCLLTFNARSFDSRKSCRISTALCRWCCWLFLLSSVNLSNVCAVNNELWSQFRVFVVNWFNRFNVENNNVSIHSVWSMIDL